MAFDLRNYDRRKTKRFNTEICTTYSSAKLTTEAKGEGIVINLSRGGIGLDLYDKPKKKSHILVEIPLKWSRVNLTAGGRITWVKVYGGLTSCGIKIDWTSNEEEYKDYIERLGVASGRH